MKRSLFMLSVLTVATLATAPAANVSPPARFVGMTMTGAEKALTFQLAAPLPESVGDARELWATWYHMPTVEAAKDGGLPLTGKNGKAISASLKERDWCDAAMQGSVWVRDANGEQTAYVFIDDNGPVQTNCDAQLGNLSDGIKAATRRARFAAFKHPRGCDVRPIPLMPYRTIAVDPKRFKMGTVFYVPALVGEAFWLEGELFEHDGYVVASDRGGAIEGNHIDIFVADVARDPFPHVIKSRAGATFEAFIVHADDPAAKALKASHDEVCEGVAGPGRPKAKPKADKA